MDDLSKLSQGLGGSGEPGPALAGLASGIQEEGGLDALLGKLRDAGLGSQVDSWIGGGPNEPVEPQRLGAALGDDEVQRLSAKSGLDIGMLLPLLAAFLPQIINMLTPDGKAPEGGLDQATGGGMPDLGGLLGGLIGGGAAGGTGTGGLDDLLGGLGGMLGGDRDR
jgi:uncharacterized protein YidB (DUF937 family)